MEPCPFNRRGDDCAMSQPKLVVAIPQTPEGLSTSCLDGLRVEPPCRTATIRSSAKASPPSLLGRRASTEWRHAIHYPVRIVLSTHPQHLEKRGGDSTRIAPLCKPYRRKKFVMNEGDSNSCNKSATIQARIISPQTPSRSRNRPDRRHVLTPQNPSHPARPPCLLAYWGCRTTWRDQFPD